MAKQNTTKAAETDAPKRKVLTAAERVAALEAQLEAAKKKAAEKADKQGKELVAKRDSLLAQIADRRAKIEKIDAELEAIGYVEGTEPDDEAPAEDKAS